jgi:ABC-type transport system involved in multi-copper enzyme maturation permease subunit
MTGTALPRPRARPLIAGLAHSEWTKLQTLRSTYWTLAVAAGAMAAFGALLSAAYTRHLTPASRAALDPAAYSLSGFFFAQLAIGVLGVLVITGEYATGSIRSTLAAAPQRLAVLTAKAGVFTAAAFAALTALVIFVPIAAGALPATWQNHVNPYLPSVAGQVIIGRTKFTPAGHLLAPWTGFAVFCGYTLAALTAAAIALHHRDA